MLKTLRIISITSIMLIMVQISFSQNTIADTIVAKEYFALGDKYYGQNTDSSTFYYQKAADIYKQIAEKNKDTLMWQKHIRCLYDASWNLTAQLQFENSLNILDTALIIALKYLGNCNKQTANIYDGLGNVYKYKSEYDKALEYYNKSLEIRLEILGEKHIDVASSYYTIGAIYYDKSEYNKALEYHNKSLEIRLEILGEKHTDVASSYHCIGVVYNDISEYDKALEYHNKSLEIRLELLGEKHTDVAVAYINIGNVYQNKSEYDKALEYHQKSLEITLELFGEKHTEFAIACNNIGVVCKNKAEYEKALEYFQKSLKIFIDLLGEKHTYVASSYNNIGNVYDDKAEYDKALEYYEKSLKIWSEILGEKHTDIAVAYNNIGLVYQNKSEYDKALEYHNKSLEIRLELLGEKHTDVAFTYNNIGNVYAAKSEYDKALEYYQKSLKIVLELLGEKHTYIAVTYNNIGIIYKWKAEYNKALEYYNKSLETRLELLGEKHTDVALTYNNIGHIYQDKSEYDKALEYYQKALASNLLDFNYDGNVLTVPKISNYLEYNELLESLHAKAEIFADTSITLTKLERLKLALKHLQACDTIITQVRREISTLSDKIALGESAAYVYNGAMHVSSQLAQLINTEKAEKYKQFAFYFSEQNKSQVLLQALSGQEAQKFAGIPDSLLKKEKNLIISINFYKQNLAEGLDSITERNFRDKLFRANRQYEELISNFETSYPEYYSLKYSTKNPSVKDLQKLLDAKTAIRSYFVGDSTIYIFTISNKKFDVQQVAKIDNLEDTIRYFRYGLTKFSQRMTDMYRRTGILLYQQLFPESLCFR
jgi:tetratricopeptide (TPR) repeat protein